MELPLNSFHSFERGCELLDLDYVRLLRQNYRMFYSNESLRKENANYLVHELLIRAGLTKSAKEFLMTYNSVLEIP